METEGQLGSRLRRARQARGLSLQEVANHLTKPVTRAALSKYERGEVFPRADVLLDLARILELAPSYFLEHPKTDTQVRWLAYRKHSRLGVREAERIEAHAELLSEAYLRLLDLLEPGSSAPIPKRRVARSADDAEKAAAEMRSLWGLGDGPLEHLVDRAEDAGVLILGWNEDNRFDALSGWVGDSLPIVVLNLQRPSDRRRFNLAHELGHLVLDAASLAPADEERLAHRFAAAFLVPASAAHREVGVRRANLTVFELEQLKKKYGVSMQAWTRRVRDLGIITDTAYREWQIWFRSQGLHVRETAEYGMTEEPSRLRRLFVRALAERLVDREWVRQMYPQALEDASRDLSKAAAALARRKPEERAHALEQAAADAASDYEKDPEVTEFLSFDDEEPSY